MEDRMRDALDQARTASGGPSALARALSATGAPISPQAISQWERVPPERVLEVERLTGVSRHELRPDVFGPAPKRATPEARVA